MSNAFLRATAYAIDRHGLTATYSVITEGVYNVDTSTTTNTSTAYSVKMYMRQIRASQYNYPNLIGQDSGLFYILATNLAFTPQPQDFITYSGKTYKVDSIQSHSADGAIVLYRVLAVI